ncbi:BTB/POZ domain-containing protein 3-like [Sitodiplosis mosellana]|uniref:BTB/POZ domain-containing protein 3-like n=1 Tax=Sitodiplosis mosellana TaxID=263140 RepID=UPI002443B4E8|nr:BTB/POZ domain-containing protein 3-like [Sitodiplosis mosellana]
MSSNETPAPIDYENVGLTTSVWNLYLNVEIADVNFIITSSNGQEDRIPAHKVLLASRSDVFKAMFYGPAKEEGDVKIVDTTSTAFKQFLQFFYFGRVSLTMENIGYVLGLVNKYNMPDGMNVCVSFIKDTLTENNACTAYGLAILYDQDNLKQFAEQQISRNTKAVFESASFLKCNHAILGHILNIDILSCPEVEVFKACIAWVKAASGREVLTRKIVRTHLVDLFYEIGFGLMTYDEFAALVPVYGNLFSKEEYIEIIQMIGSNDFESKIFKNNPRMLKKSLIECNRIDENQMIESGHTYSSEGIENVSFSSNKTLMLHEIVCQNLSVPRDGGPASVLSTEVTIIQDSCITGTITVFTETLS